MATRTVTIVKPTVDTRLGVQLGAADSKAKGVKVLDLMPNSLLAPLLTKGHHIVSINGTLCNRGHDAAAEMLKGATHLSLEVMDPPVTKKRFSLLSRSKSSLKKQNSAGGSGVADSGSVDLSAASVPTAAELEVDEDQDAETYAEELVAAADELAAASEPSPMRPMATTALADGYTFLRLTVHRRGGGLGIGLGEANVVTELVEGGPGDEAGIEIDDQLVEVNGISVFETELSVAELIPKGDEPLILGMRRPPLSLASGPRFGGGGGAEAEESEAMEDDDAHRGESISARIQREAAQRQAEALKVEASQLASAREAQAEAQAKMDEAARAAAAEAATAKAAAAAAEAEAKEAAELNRTRQRFEEAERKAAASRKSAEEAAERQALLAAQEEAEFAAAAAEARSKLKALGYGPAFDVVVPCPTRERALGISLEYMDDTHGLPELTEIGEGGLVQLSGRIKVGDVLTKVNGVDTSRGSEDLTEAIASSVEHVTLTLCRLPEGHEGNHAPPHATPATPASASPAANLAAANPLHAPVATATSPPRAVPSVASSSFSPPRPPPPAAASRLPAHSPPFNVQMTRPSQTVSLGINVEFLDEDEEGHAGHGLPEITALRPGGLAEAASVLHVGDVLMAVNGINVSEDPDELISALSSAVGTITFTILRPLPPAVEEMAGQQAVPPSPADEEPSFVSGLLASASSALGLEPAVASSPSVTAASSSSPPAAGSPAGAPPPLPPPSAYAAPAARGAAGEAAHSAPSAGGGGAQGDEAPSLVSAFVARAESQLSAAKEVLGYSASSPGAQPPAGMSPVQPPAAEPPAGSSIVSAMIARAESIANNRTPSEAQPASSTAAAAASASAAAASAAASSSAPAPAADATAKAAGDAPAGEAPAGEAPAWARGPSFPAPPPRGSSFSKRKPSFSKADGTPGSLSREASFPKTLSREASFPKTLSRNSSFSKNPDGTPGGGGGAPGLSRRRNTSWGRSSASFERGEHLANTVALSSGGPPPPPPPRRGNSFAKSEAPREAEEAAAVTEGEAAAVTEGEAAADQAPPPPPPRLGSAVTTADLFEDPIAQAAMNTDDAPAPGGEPGEEPGGGGAAGGSTSGAEGLAEGQAAAGAVDASAIASMPSLFAPGGAGSGAAAPAPAAVGSDAEYSLAMKDGRAANDAGDIARAREIFARCFEASGRYQAAVSAANMALKLGDPKTAYEEYTALLERYHEQMTDETLRLISRKMNEAVEAVERLRAQGELSSMLTEEQVAAMRLQASARGHITRKYSPDKEERHYRATLQAANRANAAGQYANARELFFELYMLKGRIETRLSAANMTLKLGEVAAALAEYQYFDDELFGTLTPKGQKVLRVKLAEAEKLVKRQQQQQQQGGQPTPTPARKVRVRNLSVREEDPTNPGSGEIRYVTRQVSVGAELTPEEREAALKAAAGPLASRPGMGGGGPGGGGPGGNPALVGGVPAGATSVGGTGRAGATSPPGPGVDEPGFDVKPPEAQAESLTKTAIEQGLAQLNEKDVEEEWLLVSKQQMSAEEVMAATKLQATMRGKAAREQVGSNKWYIETLQAGQAANKAGEYAQARKLFLEAHDISGRAEPKISATNMRLKLFEVPPPPNRPPPRNRPPRATAFHIHSAPPSTYTVCPH